MILLHLSQKRFFLPSGVSSFYSSTSSILASSNYSVEAATYAGTLIEFVRFAFFFSALAFADATITDLLSLKRL